MSVSIVFINIDDAYNAWKRRGEMHMTCRTYIVKAADLSFFLRFYFVWTALTVIVQRNYIL
jgi:hypothetical protein